WASTFTLFKIAWHDIDPVAFTAIRFAAMVPFSLGLLALTRNRVRPRREDLPLLVASGLTGYFLYQMGFVLGLERTSALASAILISTHPIFSVLFARLARRERPTRNEAVRRRGIPRTVVYGFLVPVLGGAIAVLALHGPLRPEQVAGALLVVAGLMLTRLRLARRPPRSPEATSQAPSSRAEVAR